jgi:hypothetical protein
VPSRRGSAAARPRLEEVETGDRTWLGRIKTDPAASSRPGFFNPTSTNSKPIFFVTTRPIIRAAARIIGH